jgi:hypothetical protein
VCVREVIGYVYHTSYSYFAGGQGVVIVKEDEEEEEEESFSPLVSPQINSSFGVFY